MKIDKKTITELGKSVGSKITLTVSSQISEKIEKDFPGIKGPVVRLNIISDKQEIKEFNGGKLKITIPYKLKESETKDKLIVYAIDDNNNLNLNKYVLYDEKASSVVFETEKLSSFAVGYEVFDDINNHWAYDSIHNAYARGLFSGTGEHIFSPDENTTRAMFVTVLSRYEKAESKNSTINFSDVQDGAWYKEAVAWASSNNIIKGINDREFGCNKEITREQMAVILSRYIKELGINILSSDENIKYSDSKEISSWAEEAVSYMQKTGLMKGKENNEFDPKAPATRAEISVIINRLSSIK